MRKNAHLATMALTSPRMKNIADANAKRSKTEQIKTKMRTSLIDEPTLKRLQDEFSKPK